MFCVCVRAVFDVRMRTADRDAAADECVVAGAGAGDVCVTADAATDECVMDSAGDVCVTADGADDSVEPVVDIADGVDGMTDDVDGSVDQDDENADVDDSVVGIAFIADDVIDDVDSHLMILTTLLSMTTSIKWMTLLILLTAT